MADDNFITDDLSGSANRAWLKSLRLRAVLTAITSGPWATSPEFDDAALLAGAAEEMAADLSDMIDKLISQSSQTKTAHQEL